MIQDLFIYTDASFSKAHEIAVLGYGYMTCNGDTLCVSQLKLQSITVVNNIRAEIISALQALEESSQAKNVTLYTDCAVICGLPDRRKKLEKNNYISKAKNIELANADLYKQFYKLSDQLNLKIVWLKGHMPKDQQTIINKNFSILDKAVRNKLRQTVN